MASLVTVMVYFQPITNRQEKGGTAGGIVANQKLNTLIAQDLTRPMWWVHQAIKFDQTIGSPSHCDLYRNYFWLRIQSAAHFPAFNWNIKSH